MISRIFIDIDGVLANWTAAVIQLYGLNPEDVYARWGHGVYDLDKVLRVSQRDMWQRINVGGPRFWADLDPYPWTFKLYHHCMKTAPTTVLSITSDDAMSGAGKMLWLHHHLPRAPYFIGSENKAVCSGPGRVLIDDKDSNCRDFVQQGGAAIVFPQPWNSARAWTGNRMKYVTEQLREIGR